MPSDDAALLLDTLAELVALTLPLPETEESPVVEAVSLLEVDTVLIPNILLTWVMNVSKGPNAINISVLLSK